MLLSRNFSHFWVYSKEKLSWILFWNLSKNGRKNFGSFYAKITKFLFNLIQKWQCQLLTKFRLIPLEIHVKINYFICKIRIILMKFWKEFYWNSSNFIHVLYFYYFFSNNVESIKKKSFCSDLFNFDLFCDIFMYLCTLVKKLIFSKIFRE